MAKEMGQQMPKTIIFCNTLKHVATVANELLLRLGSSAYIPNTSKNPKDCLLGIFHSMTWEKRKEELLEEFKGDGKKRIIVATSALSMGVNFPDVRYIINWGPARNLLDHHQEAGRAGRDGKIANVIVIYHGNQLAHCEDDVKDFVKSSGCLRVASYKPFDEDIKPWRVAHDCCSNCRATCCCQENMCGTRKLPFEKNYSVINQEHKLSRPISVADKEDLSAALQELQIAESSEEFLFDKTSAHGFSQQLIDDIVKNCATIFTVEDIMDSCPVFSLNHAFKILEVFDELFNDIELTNMVDLLGLELLEEQNIL